jgi:hypothetical protein
MGGRGVEGDGKCSFYVREDSITMKKFPIFLKQTVSIPFLPRKELYQYLFPQNKMYPYLSIPFPRKDFTTFLFPKRYCNDAFI